MFLEPGGQVTSASPLTHVWATKLVLSPLEEGESESHSLVSPRPHL